MYLRSTPRRNKDGSEVRYLQLAHNEWDPRKRRSAMQVVYSFGREDAGTARRCSGCGRVAGLLDGPALAGAAPGWTTPGPVARRDLGAGRAVGAAGDREGDGRMLKGRRRDEAAERVLFALVANRALEPSSKLAAARWAAEDARSPACRPRATTPATGRWTG